MSKLSRRTLIGGMAFAPLAGCALARPATLAMNETDNALFAIEQRCGGRLGVCLVDQRGTVVVAHRAEERFAMCSTFKVPLSGVMLRRSQDEGEPIDTALPVSRDDIVFHSPRVAAALDAAGGMSSTMSIADLCAATVQVSDNGAANILLRHIGGPAAFTAAIRAMGDNATRLDRYETALNENAAGDLRDTSTPLALAMLSSALCFGQALEAEGHLQLRTWMAGTTTGPGRIRAGVPIDWDVGNKTGTGGANAPAVHDLAYIIGRRTPRAINSSPLMLAVMIDRPTSTLPETESAIAEVARVAISAWQAA